MIVIDRIAEVRRTVAQWRRQGLRIAFVPTMGNLHAGHIHLVEQARALADRVVVSIFVNPLQFGEGEDFATYPRTPDQDRQMLEAAGTELLFTPEVAEMYPRPLAETTRIEVPGLSGILCGEQRPGHFAGVATVVNRFLNIVQADCAVFGKKDFQQLLVIRRMVEDLCLPVEIVGVATVREADGLAMSSRNRYLTREQRQCAPAIYRTLVQLRERIQAGEREFDNLEREGVELLRSAGFRPDYVSIRRLDDLQPPVSGSSDDLVVLAAARIGTARLIDNIPVALPDAP